MSQNDFLFLLEALIRKDERHLLDSLLSDPNNKGLLAVYADYLEENDRPISARMVREKEYVPSVGETKLYYHGPTTSGAPVSGLTTMQGFTYSGIIHTPIRQNPGRFA